MKKILFFFLLAVILTGVLFFSSKEKSVQLKNIPGVYIFNSEIFTDSLVLYPNGKTIHCFLNKKTKGLKKKDGEWSFFSPSTITIHDYSFAIANYPVDLKIYYDFFGVMKIDFNHIDTYSKVSHLVE